MEGTSDPLGYMAAYAKIDIALDPFSHNGGTTSHDCLWMGVPLISLEGDRYVSRFGVAILSNLGHPEWIAGSCDDYKKIAVELASDIKALNIIRLGMRQKMAASPLCDGPGFAKRFGEALRTIWKEL